MASLGTENMEHPNQVTLEIWDIVFSACITISVIKNIAKITLLYQYDSYTVLKNKNQNPFKKWPNDEFEMEFIFCLILT